MGLSTKSPDRITQGMCISFSYYTDYVLISTRRINIKYMFVFVGLFEEEEEANIGVENQPRATTSIALDRSQILKTRNWWICIFVCSGLVVTGRVISTLLLNFYFIQTGRDACDDPKQFKGVHGFNLLSKTLRFLL